MSDDIRVFHYQDGYSDKIWAICTTKNQTSTFTVWFGRRGSSLTSKNVPADQSVIARIDSKLRKGYVELPDMTVNPETGKVESTSSSQPFQAIPDALWYRVSQPSRFDEVLERLDAIEHALEKDAPSEASVFRSLSLVSDLRAMKPCSCHELSEGPLGVLLLFSLRRYFTDAMRREFSELSNLPNSESLIEVADDSNELLPFRYDVLEPILVGSCKAHLIKQGDISDLEARLLDDDHVRDAAQKAGLEHYCSTKSAKPIAILVGCIDAPVDLSIIRPDQQSAFF